MSNIREHLYLAALLHDIGKFYQRADSGSVSTSRCLNQIVKGLEDFVLPRNPMGTYTHKHALWTAQFIEDYREVFQQLASGTLADLTDKDNLINLAAGHHLPYSQQTQLGAILKKADSLSSGMDREGEAAFKDDQDENAWDSFKTKRMIPITQNIGGFEDDKNIYHQPLSAIKLDKAYFPKQFAGGEVPDYAALWNSFKADFNLIQSNTYHAFAETLLNLLFKYTTAIPASTINFPDVSLYDHLKTTAAIAICLYDYETSQEKGGDAPFLLVGGDFSGIQSYIYQIISKYASKNLKGRSFYLKLLSDAVVRYLLQQLDLFQSNIVYNSGGSFYLLAPNTMAVKEKLQKAIQFIEEQLFQAHGISLFVAIDSVEVSENDLKHTDKEHNLRIVWQALFQKRDVKKQSRFASMITQNYNRFFAPFMYAEGQRDVVTGELFAEGEKPCRFSDDKDKVVRHLTNQQIKLGTALRESKVMVVSEGEIPYWKDKVSISPANLGICYYLLQYEDLTKMKEELRASADKVTAISLNGKNLDCDFMRNIEGLNNIYALEFYGGNIYSENTFEQMCDNKNEFSRMGVLRMDVDNLGSIFQGGIAKERATLSRYAALSRSLDYFFSGYLNRIQQDIAPLKSSIIYSGGDDVFIVGAWDVVIQIAKRIHNDFKAYTCYNPKFSLSGGMTMVGSKYPIIKGAELSGEEESNAKGHSYAKEGKEYQKNSFSFMGMPLNWDKEFPMVEELKNTLVALCEHDMLPKSFLSKVMMHAQNANIENHAVKNVKVFWMLTYDLSRMKQTLKNADAKDVVENCKKEVCGNNKTLNGEPIITAYHPLELWMLAARWAELQIRTNKQ